MGTARKIPVVLFGDYIGAFGVIRSMSQIGVDIYLVSPRGDGLCTRSRFVKSTFIMEPSNPRLVQATKVWLSQEGVSRAVAIIADDDEYLDALSKRHDDLAPELLATFPEWQRVANVRDKWKTISVATGSGVDVPGTFLVGSRAELLSRIDSEDLRYPVLLKVVESRRFFRKYKKKGIVCQSKSEVLSAYDDYEGFEGQLLIQDYIPGGEDQLVNLILACRSDGSVAEVFINRKRRSVSTLGNCTLMESTWSDEALAAALRLSGALKYVGYCNPEFKYDRRDGKLKLMEINGRVTLSNSHALRCGVDVVRVLYEEAIGMRQDRVTAFSQRYASNVLWWSPVVDLYGLLSSVMKGRIHLVTWVRQLLGRGIIVEPFRLRDIKPGIYYLVKTAKSLLLRRGT